MKTLEEQCPHILDVISEAKKDLFKLNNGLMHCLSTVLMQEIERFNRLLNKIKSSLKSLDQAIQGLVLMSSELDEMYGMFLKNKVPNNWQEVSYPSLKPLSSWFADLVLRVEFMRNWLTQGHPKCYWLSGFFFPHGFMTGTLQTYARKIVKEIDCISFSFKFRTETDVSQIKQGPDDGIYVYGLYIEGARWNFKTELLDDQHHGEMHSIMPIIHFLPKVDHVPKEDDYKCPVYKTSVRAGVLSTTGQSTNFILAIEIPQALES